MQRGVCNKEGIAVGGTGTEGGGSKMGASKEGDDGKKRRLLEIPSSARGVVYRAWLLSVSNLAPGWGSRAPQARISLKLGCYPCCTTLSWLTSPKSYAHGMFEM